MMILPWNTMSTWGNYNGIAYSEQLLHLLNQQLSPQRHSVQAFYALSLTSKRNIHPPGPVTQPAVCQGCLKWAANKLFFSPKERFDLQDLVAQTFGGLLLCLAPYHAMTSISAARGLKTLWLIHGHRIKPEAVCSSTCPSLVQQATIRASSTAALRNAQRYLL